MKSPQDIPVSAQNCDKRARRPVTNPQVACLSIGTIDLRVDYLQQGQGHSFSAKAHVMRLGGRIASTQMTLENEAGNLIATGSAAYAVG